MNNPFPFLLMLFVAVTISIHSIPVMAITPTTGTNLSMSVQNQGTTQPPRITFDGVLRNSTSFWGIPGKTITISCGTGLMPGADTTVTFIFTVTTDMSGSFLTALNYGAPEWTWFRAVFPGDETYQGTSCTVAFSTSYTTFTASSLSTMTLTITLTTTTTATITKVSTTDYPVITNTLTTLTTTARTTTLTTYTHPTATTTTTTTTSIPLTIYFLVTTTVITPTTVTSGSIETMTFTVTSIVTPSTLTIFPIIVIIGLGAALAGTMALAGIASDLLTNRRLRRR